MSARVTPAEVRQILSTGLTDLEIGAYIVAANSFVVANLGPAGLTEIQLKEIERWITAHFIASTREQQSKEEGAGGAYVKYQGVTGEGLSATMYGQQAVLLDTSGTLAEIVGGRRKASMAAITSFS